MKDSKLNAFMGVLTCKELTAQCTKKITDFEQELALLNAQQSGKGSSEWWVFSDPIQSRIDFLTRQIGINSTKVVELDTKSTHFKTLLKVD